MIERTRRPSRFKTPPETQSIKVIREITNPENNVLIPKTEEDFLRLIDQTPQIEIIKWIKYFNKQIHFALYSNGPNLCGYGGSCLDLNEFIGFVKKVAKRIKAGRKIKFEHKSGDAK